MAKRRKGDPVHGWLVIDKPAGLTSNAVLNKARRLLNAQKAGHGGTLDPMATGVLPIALGEATKLVHVALQGTKRYRFTLAFGAETDSGDLEGSVTETSDERPEDDAIQAILPRFTGEIEQVPPKFSAIKIDGERAYDLARDGHEVEMPVRQVTINSLTFIDRPGRDHAVFEVVCGAGTYVRSLARDMARALGTRGHVSVLRRTAAGPFRADQAILLDDLDARSITERQAAAVHPLMAALDDIPALPLTQRQAQQLRLGQTIRFLSRQDAARLTRIARIPSDSAILAVCQGVPVALVTREGAAIKPQRVLNLGS